MSRIVAGTFGGRRLATPPGEDTRPTSDRVREAMFSALDSANALYGRRFLDLYAGSGAVGLEAASRGAEHVMLVESDPKAVKVIRDNIAMLAVHGVSVSPLKVASALATGPGGGGYDTVFVDPPYAMSEDDLHDVLRKLAELGWLNQGARVVVERSKRSPEPPWVEPVTGERSRRYGETVLWYGRRS